jgi:heme exporter protein A
VSLRFRDVACVRGGRMLFSGVSFDLGPGDAALVIGPNGVGKSSVTWTRHC